MDTSDFELLIILDSPLIDMMAPELLPLREEARAMVRETKQDCTPCQQRALYARQLKLQIQLVELLQTNPSLAELVPQLRASAKQVYDAR